jgi:hypothetical protein
MLVKPEQPSLTSVGLPYPYIQCIRNDGAFGSLQTIIRCAVSNTARAVLTELQEDLSTVKR